MRLASALSAACALTLAQGVPYRIVRVDTPVPILSMPGTRALVVVHPMAAKPMKRRRSR